MGSALTERQIKWFRIGLVCGILALEIACAAYIPKISKNILNDILNYQDFWIFAVVWYRFLHFLKSITRNLGDLVLFPLVNNTIKNMTFLATKKLYYAPQCTSEAGAISALKRIFPSIRRFVRALVFDVVPTIIKSIIAVFMLYKVNIRFVPWVLLGIVLLNCFFVYFYFQSRVKAWRQTDYATQSCGDLLKTKPWTFLSHSQGALNYFYSRLSHEAEKWLITNNRLNFMYIAQEIGIWGLMTYCFIDGIQLIRQHSLEPADFMLIQGYLVMVIVPLRRLLSDVRKIFEFQIDMEKVFKYTSLPSEPIVYPTLLRDSLTIDDVDLDFDGRCIFKNLTLTVHVGDKILLQGPSGSGKSSLAGLMLGMIKPTRGAIDFFGDNAGLLHSPDIAYIPHNPQIFFEDVAFHLNLDGACDDSDLMQALHEVSLVDIDVKAPMSHLSQGQRQRVFLAQIFLKKPKFLILDEATNCLEPELEETLLKKICHSVPTVIVISHHSYQFIRHKLWTIKHNSVVIAQQSKKFIKSA